MATDTAAWEGDDTATGRDTAATGWGDFAMGGAMWVVARVDGAATDGAETELSLLELGCCAFAMVVRADCRRSRKDLEFRLFPTSQLGKGHLISDRIPPDRS